jgi:hypothetical protein
VVKGKLPTRTPGGGMSFADVFLLAQRLPGVEESTSYGTAAIKANGKLLARVWEDDATLVLRCTPTVRAHLLSSSPAVFHLTDHYRDYPWVLVRLGAVSESVLAPLLEDAWRLVVSKQAAAAFAAQSDRT